MTEYNIEVLKKECSETDEWYFRSDIRVRIENPDGKDVIILATHKTKPKYDDLVHNPYHIHEKIQAWEPNSYSSQGDTPICEWKTTWEPQKILYTDSELLDECLESVIYDPQALMDSISVKR